MNLFTNLFKNGVDSSASISLPATAFQKLLALAGGIGTMISLIPKFFSGSNTKVEEAKE